MTALNLFKTLPQIAAAAALITGIAVSSASATSIGFAPGVTPVDMNSDYAQPSCDAWGHIKTAYTGKAKAYTFWNSSETYRSVYWLDQNGHEVHYADVKPGKSFSVDSYKGHPWLVTDGHGDCLMVVKNGAKAKYKHGGKGNHGSHAFYPNYEVDKTMPYGGKLNMRYGPGTKYAKVHKLHEGEGVEHLKARGNWVKVKTDGGIKGWVSARFLKVIN